MRTYVITGAASGIGPTTADLLLEQGHTALGVDLFDADITADVGSPAGRHAPVDDETRRTDGRIDAVTASAGPAIPTAATFDRTHLRPGDHRRRRVRRCFPRRLDAPRTTRESIEFSRSRIRQEVPHAGTVR